MRIIKRGTPPPPKPDTSWPRTSLYVCPNCATEFLPDGDEQLYVHYGMGMIPTTSSCPCPVCDAMVRVRMPGDWTLVERETGKRIWP
jgi:hypothetical protein